MLWATIIIYYTEKQGSLWPEIQHRFLRNPLQWGHNGHDTVSSHQPHDCLLNHLFRRRSKKTSKLRVTGLCAVNSPVTGEFPAQMASNAENVSIWWRHHAGHFISVTCTKYTLQWRRNERNGVSNHRRLNYLLNRLFGHSSKKTSKLRVTGLCEGNSQVTDEFHAQRASSAGNVSIWWRHHE